MKLISFRLKHIAIRKSPDSCIQSCFDTLIELDLIILERFFFAYWIWCILCQKLLFGYRMVDFDSWKISLDFLPHSLILFHLWDLETVKFTKILMEFEDLLSWLILLEMQIIVHIPQLIFILLWIAGFDLIFNGFLFWIFIKEILSLLII